MKLQARWRAEQLKLGEELAAIIAEMRNLLYQIRGSRKGSIGSIENVYVCQLDRGQVDRLADRLAVLSSHLQAQEEKGDTGGTRVWVCYDCDKWFLLERDVCECGSTSITAGWFVKSAAVLEMRDQQEEEQHDDQARGRTPAES